MTSTMKQRWAVSAESLILSTSVTMLLSALSDPMEMSLAGTSLLIVAGTHTIGIDSSG